MSICFRRIKMQLFQHDQYLNDAIINFAIAHAFENIDETEQHKIYIFDNNFYTKLSEKSQAEPDESHTNVRNMTKKIYLFGKQLIIIPVCETGHWFLLLVINPGVVTVRQTVR